MSEPKIAINIKPIETMVIKLMLNAIGTEEGIDKAVAAVSIRLIANPIIVSSRDCEKVALTKSLAGLP